VVVGKSFQRKFWGLLVCCFMPGPSAAQNTATANPLPPAHTDAQEASARLSFVRSFSSADDVRGPLHPVLDRTLDIIAGPKNSAPQVDALKSASAVATDSGNRVLIADPSAKVVHLFDFVNSKYGLLDRGNDRLGTPVSLAVDGQDNLYVVDERSRTILVYDSAGKFRRSLGRLSGGESYFESPAGIAIDTATGRIYVCDTHRHMIIAMDDRGRLIAKAGKRGGGDRPGEFKLPRQVVWGGNELFVLDVGNARIQILDSVLHFRRAINLAYADHRTGLAIDGQGNIYVSDPVLNRIQVLNPEGRTLYLFDPSTLKDANFGRPSAMWVSSGSCLYVVDSQNDRIGLFQIVDRNAPKCR